LDHRVFDRSHGVPEQLPPDLQRQAGHSTPTVNQNIEDIELKMSTGAGVLQGIEGSPSVWSDGDHLTVDHGVRREILTGASNLRESDQ
jgi:hypothetical protein